VPPPLHYTLSQFDLVGRLQGRRPGRARAPYLHRAGDRRVRQAVRSAAVPHRQGGGAELVFRRPDRERLAHLRRRHAADGRRHHRADREPRLTRRGEHPLAQAGARRRHADLSPPRSGVARIDHAQRRRPGEASLGSREPARRARPHDGRLGLVRPQILMAARIDLHHKVHVLTKKEELASVRLPGKVVVVLDILFATSTMVTALAHGAKEVIPVLDGGAARACAKTLDDDSYVLSGELYAETLPGFAHPAPLALLKHGVKGKSVIYSTTDGTVAMTQPAQAAAVYCGALLNARALVEHILARHARETVLVVCSGSGNNFNLEDFYGAGYFVECFLERVPDLSDAARAAL